MFDLVALFLVCFIIGLRALADYWRWLNRGWDLIDPGEYY